MQHVDSEHFVFCLSALRPPHRPLAKRKTRQHAEQKDEPKDPARTALESAVQVHPKHAGDGRHRKKDGRQQIEPVRDLDGLQAESGCRLGLFCRVKVEGILGIHVEQVQGSFQIISPVAQVNDVAVLGSRALALPRPWMASAQAWACAGASVMKVWNALLIKVCWSLIYYSFLGDLIMFRSSVGQLVLQPV